MKYRILLTLIFAVATISIATQSSSAPPPVPSEVSSSWELEFDFDAPVPVTLTVPGEKKPRTFWYMQYRVANRTGEDQIFVPEFVLYTDKGEVIPAGRSAPIAVFNAIKKMHNNPLLKDFSAITGKLLQGEDNAKEGLAIWPDFDNKVGTVDIFIGGLSGETAEIKLPRPITVTETDANGKAVEVEKDTILLSKTLQVTYRIPATADGRGGKPAQEIGREWIMR